MEHMIEAVKVSSAITPAAGVAAQTVINSSILDTAGYDGTLFLLRMGLITSGAVCNFRVQQGANSNMSDAADLTGTLQAIADTSGNAAFYCDIKRTGDRYIRAQINRSTQDSVISDCLAIQYLPRSKATSQGNGVSGESFDSPAEGTA